MTLPPPAIDRTPKPLHLATYNIHRCVGWDRRYDPARTIRVIQELSADVIALQEVESHGHDGREFLLWLGHETGLDAIPGPTVLRGVGDFGNALLVRPPVRTIERLDLSLRGREPRGALDVELEWEGAAVQVVTTHLGLRPAERRAQTLRLMERFSRDDPRPALLLGDLNEWWLWGRPLRWLQSIFGPTPAPATFPVACPLFALDRIWARRPVTLQHLRPHRSPLARLASDHFPLKAVMVWPESAADAAKLKSRPSNP